MVESRAQPTAKGRENVTVPFSHRHRLQLTDGNLASHGPPGTPVRRRLPVRWWIVGMLFVGSVVNYLDRITLSIVAPMIRDEFGLSASDYALVVNVFLVAYTLFLRLWRQAGRLPRDTRQLLCDRHLVVHRRLSPHPDSGALLPLCLPFSAGSGRSGILPHRRQGHIGVVPSPRPRQAHQHHAAGSGHRRASGSAGGELAHLECRLARHVPDHGTAGISAVAALDLHLSKTGRASTADGRGAGISPGVGQCGPRRHRSKAEGPAISCAFAGSGRCWEPAPWPTAPGTSTSSGCPNT